MIIFTYKQFRLFYIQQYRFYFIDYDVGCCLWVCRSCQWVVLAEGAQTRRQFRQAHLQGRGWLWGASRGARGACPDGEGSRWNRRGGWNGEGGSLREESCWYRGEACWNGKEGAGDGVGVLWAGERRGVGGSGGVEEIMAEGEGGVILRFKKEGL